MNSLRAKAMLPAPIMTILGIRASYVWVCGPASSLILQLQKLSQQRLQAVGDAHEAKVRRVDAFMEGVCIVRAEQIVALYAH